MELSCLEPLKDYCWLSYRLRVKNFRITVSSVTDVLLGFHPEGIYN